MPALLKITAKKFKIQKTESEILLRTKNRFLAQKAARNLFLSGPMCTQHTGI
jgi:hypothetical protein